MLHLGTEVAKKWIIISMTAADLIVSAGVSTYISHFVQKKHKFNENHEETSVYKIQVFFQC